jgi:hypothetical protein
MLDKDHSATLLILPCMNTSRRESGSSDNVHDMRLKRYPSSPAQPCLHLYLHCRRPRFRYDNPIIVDRSVCMLAAFPVTVADKAAICYYQAFHDSEDDIEGENT